MKAAVPVAGRSPKAAQHGLRALHSPDELRLAGRVSGALYLTAGLTAPALLLLGTGRPPLLLLCVEAGVATAWGLACLTVVPWERAPWWLSHFSSLAGVVLTAVLAAKSGGVRSPALMYLLFVVVFAAYFYPWREALAFIVLCALVRALPLIYEPDAVTLGGVTQLAIAIPSYLVAGGAIVSGRTVASRLRERAARLSSQHERLAAEHASLRRVATAVATSAPPHAVFTLVASETLNLLEADGAAVVRYDGDEGELVGSHGPQSTHHPPGTRFPLRPQSELSVVRATGKPVRTDGYPPGSDHRGASLGYQCCVCAPIWVEQRLWGGLCVVAHEPWALAPDAEERLLEFAHLVATSIANAERQAELARRASTDELTGLPNHRSFRERLEAEVARATRHERPLSLALVDVDGFRRLNERIGHEASDGLLVGLAEVLRGLTRKGDVLARLGGDEFGVILPETDKQAAYAVIERARQAVSRWRLAGMDTVTLTAGICDLDSATGEVSLYRLADAALYWGKTHGQDVTWLYDPEIVTEPDRLLGPEDMERARALAALQALSRAIDAKDPLTRAHSDRVAALATRLAKACGWEAERVTLLEDAALVHDVGKIGIPDAILLKPAALDDDEYSVVKQHAALGAQIVEGVLTSEQVEWVRAHHERPDGRGYPNGLFGASISEGAALLAMADAFDAMTAARSYSSPKDTETAVRECRRLAGRQFTHRAVRALETIYETGLLVAA